MPKFRITSRGGTTLTKIPAALKVRYVGYATGDPKKRLTYDVVEKAEFKDGTFSIPEWPPIEKASRFITTSGRVNKFRSRSRHTFRCNFL